MLRRRDRRPSPPPVPQEPGARFDQLASLVMAFAVAVVVLAALVVSTATVGSTWTLLAAAISVVLAGSVPVLAILGLRRRRPWGRPVAILGLWLLIVSGLAQLGLSLVDGEINVPFLAIAAGFVLVAAPRPPSPRLATSDRAVVRVALGLAVASLAWWAVTILFA